MQKLTFIAEGVLDSEIEAELDNAIAMNDPSKAVDRIGLYIQKHNIKCIEVDNYLKQTPANSDIPYRRTPAFLIYGTYYRIKACARERIQFLNPNLCINKFEIWNIEKSGASCQKFKNKKYNKANLPELPHGPGCNCVLSPVFL